MKELNYIGSRNIRKVVWSDNKLTITFVSGRVYEFYSVPESVFDQMEGSLSAGEYFDRNIKGKYEYKEVKK